MLNNSYSSILNIPKIIFLFHSIGTLIIRSQFFPGSGRIMATRFNGSLKDQISEEGRSLILVLVPFHPFHSNPPHYISSIGLHSTSSIGLQSTFYILLLFPYYPLHSSRFPCCVLLVLSWSTTNVKTSTDKLSRVIN